MKTKDILLKAKLSQIPQRYTDYFMEVWKRDNGSLETLDYVSFTRNHNGVVVTYCHTSSPDLFENILLIVEE